MASDWSTWLLAALADASLRAAVLAAAVGVILCTARVPPGSVRHAAWAAVAATMLTLPMIPRVLPPIPGPVAIPVPDLSLRWAPDVEPPRAEGIATPPAHPMGRGFDPETAAGGATPAIPLWRWTDLAAAVYLAVVLVLLVRLVVGWRLARRIATTVSPVTVPGWRVVGESGIVATPVTIGIVAPRIVLPRAWRQWPAAALHAVLIHEDAHIARWDPLVTLVTRVNCVVFWFHPLAWWLARAVAANAELACDEEVARRTGDARAYGRLLVRMADEVRTQRGRVTWHGLGMHGTGGVERRVERLLAHRGSMRASRLRRAAVAVACAWAMAATAGCRNPRDVLPLQPDPALAEQFAAEARAAARRRDAAQMTRAQIDALEARLLADPADIDGWHDLRAFYEVSAQRVLGWDEMVARRRVLLTVLIEHHADHDVGLWLVSPTADPAGYEAARSRWTTRAASATATARILSNAARFLQPYDPWLAEPLLLRARRLDPDGATVSPPSLPPPSDYWSRRLGGFYGGVLDTAQALGARPPGWSSETDAYASDVRARLLQSEDATLVEAAGERLMRAVGNAAQRAFARRLLERAADLDPSLERTPYLLASMDLHDADVADRVRQQLTRAELAGEEILKKVQAGAPLTEIERGRLDEQELPAVMTLPEADRLVRLAELSIGATIQALVAQLRNKAGDRAHWLDTSVQAAHGALVLAAAHPTHPERGLAIYNAHLALAAARLRVGDRAGTVRHLLDASTAGPSRRLGAGVFGGLDRQVVNSLLDSGERDTVAQFLERAADLKPLQRQQLRDEAAAIRAGRMPRAYQTQLARRPPQPPAQ